MFGSKGAHLVPDQMTIHSTGIYFPRLYRTLEKSEEQNPFTEQWFIDFQLRQAQ